MKGLKRYSHQDRKEVIQEMIPLIRKKFGENLIALAAQASYARNEDLDYSDLELIAFVREMPKGKKIGGMGKIREGLLVELVWMTKETYIKEVKEVTKDWYIAGSDILLPIINKPFIESLNNYEVENLKEKCLNHATSHWHEVQESTAKVLNAISRKNKLTISLLVFDMYLHMLIVLSFLNQMPYRTFSELIVQSKKFKTKPEHFNDLTNIIIDGTHRNLGQLKKAVEEVFTEFESIFEELGFALYDNNVDPNKAMKKWTERI